MSNELKIWTDGEDWYIAESAKQATDFRREVCGPDADEMDPLELAPDPLRMYGNIEDPTSLTTRPQSEWIAEWVQQWGQKPGLFATSNW